MFLWQVLIGCFSSEISNKTVPSNHTYLSYFIILLIYLTQTENHLDPSSLLPSTAMSINTRNLESTSTGAGNTVQIASALLNAGKTDKTGDNRAAVTQADISTPFQISPAEEASLITELRQAAQAANNLAVAQADDFWLLASLRARKGNVERALALASNYVEWRASISADELNAARSEKMRIQLARKIIFVGGNTDRDGRPVLNIRLRNQDPSTFAAIDTTRMINFVLEWTLRTYPAAQTHGVVFVSDMSGVGLRNLDLRIPGILQKALSKTVPVRLAALYIMHAPIFMRAVFTLFQSVLSKKLKARIRLFGNGDVDRFADIFENDQVADDIDGMEGEFCWSDAQHQAWVNRMVEDCETWGPVTTYKEE